MRYGSLVFVEVAYWKELDLTRGIKEVLVVSDSSPFPLFRFCGAILLKYVKRGIH